MKAYFPGSFNPPTYGHLEVLRKACEIFEEVIVVCSTNPDKVYQISPEDRVILWKSYDLPENCRILTFEQATAEMVQGDPKVMVRGIRSGKDLEWESQVMEANHREFGFDYFFYIYTSPAFSAISSSRCRYLASQGASHKRLKKMVSRQVENYLLKTYWHVEDYPIDPYWAIPRTEFYDRREWPRW